MKGSAGGAPLLVFIALFVSVTFFPFVADPRLAREIQFCIFGIIIVLVYLANNARFLGALFVWCMYSLASHPSQAGVNQMAMLVAGVGLYRLAQDVPVRTLKMMLHIYAMSLGGMVILQAFGLFSKYYVTYNVVRPYSGFTGSTADTSSALALLLPLFFAPGGSLALGFILLAIALYLKSTVAAAAISISLFYLAWPRISRIEKHWLLGYGILAAMFFAISASQWFPEVEQAVTDDRWRIWQISISQGFANHPIVGYGLAQYQQTFGGLADGMLNEVQQVKWFAHPHNELVLVFYELGIVGLLLLLGFCASAFIRCQDRALKACLISGIIVAQGHFTWHIVVAAAPLIVLLSAARQTEWHREGSTWQERLSQHY